MHEFGSLKSTLLSSVVGRYGTAAFISCAAVAITNAVPALYGVPFAVSFVAVAASAALGGFGAGLLSAGLSVVLVNYFVMVPRWAFALSRTALIQSAVLLTVSLFICAIARQRDTRQQRLQDVEDEFELTLRSIGDAVVATDARGAVRFMNERAETLTGWSMADARGRPLEEVFVLTNAKSGAPIENPVQKVISSGEVRGLANHTSLTARDGRKLHIEDSAAPIRSTEGVLTGVVLVFRDVTREYELAEVNDQTSRSMREVLESIAEGFESFDRDWRFTYINRQGAAMTGHTPEQLLGRNHWDVFPEVGSKFHELMLTAMNQGKPGTLVEYYAPLDMWFDVRAYPSAHGVSVVFADVTERVRGEEKLRIAERLATAGRLAATVAHEINNPLEAIGNLLFIAQTATQEPAVRETLQAAEAQLNRVSHITRQTLSFYKPSQDAVRRETVAATVRELAELYKSRAISREVQITPVVEQDFACFIAHGELVQVVSNLLSNALDATPRRTQVTVLVRQRDGVGEIAVSDEGGGVPELARDKIFEPFYTTKMDVGTGLGLWVVRNIVQKRGGTIHVDSASGSGARFTVTLPLAP